MKGIVLCRVSSFIGKAPVRCALFLAFAVVSLAVAAEEGHAQKPPVHVKRDISLPPFNVWSNASGDTQSTYDYGQARYTVVLCIATWSSRARELAAFFQSKQAELEKRKVALVGAFTQDSTDDIRKFRQELGITYHISQLSLDFVVKMLNPKVQTIWILDQNGQIVHRLVRPSPQGFEQVYKMVLSWTDF